jgi:CubicO group peptidase (beta-lactamase class C family)
LLTFGENTVMKILAPIAVLATSTLFCPALADGLPIAVPEKVGLSSERLQVLTATLKGEVEKGQLPGAVIAVARRGQLAYFEAVGFRDAQSKAPMPQDAIFSIASMTKPMVSVAIMMLHDEGRLFLSDPVGKYLPALANMQVAVIKTDTEGKNSVQTVPAQRQPTIQDLLRHTSGFIYGGRGTTEVHKMWPASSSVASVTYTGPEFIAALSKAPLLYQPGTVWDYSLSVDVLGLIVEGISGKSLGAFLEERIWKPLGMVDTGFSIPDTKKARYALAFPNDPLTNKPQSVLHAAGKPLKFECGGGCAVSTAMDYLRFAQMLANNGTLEGQRILSRKTVEMMTTDQLGAEIRARSISPLLAEGYSFGLGFTVRTESGRAALAGSIGDFSWGGAFGTYFWVDPKEEMAVVFMAAAPSEIRAHLRTLTKNLVLAAIVD